MNKSVLPDQELVKILLPAYNPCPAFNNVCSEMRWAPEKGHAPRGFCGATGSLRDVKLVLIVAEPGDPHNGESNLSSISPNELISETVHYSYRCYETGKDLFHRNVQDILELFWPGLDFEEKMQRTWITESVLCSALNEGGNIPSAIWKQCVKRYLIPQIEILDPLMVLALGSKARNRTRGIENIIPVGAAAPPGCNFKGTRKSWEEQAKEFLKFKNSNKIGSNKCC